jgi:DNA mismatch repair protein MutL
MTIAILPARLANQIAAGEVVERPASVVKELVENSLDAGATSIRVDIEKGGAKRIRIVDNGKGITKDELGLALSRHATSKIKDLNDLEAISSLGFRGEALASISSVSRLTLTSKPQAQTSAWQANAEGRDMAVTVNPAAHPDGTTIDVIDLFFNTPARRKFLRTEKTEFGHIEEVIKRIALARFDVAFVLTHNHKVIKQFRLANSTAQRSKRVAQICGQKFIDNALEVDCQHDGFHIHGWIGQPSFYRSQNDLSYSYVNGRMMRDKLINHAIRQAYAELLPKDSYPAFVLFLELDFREVDVNVHPAKHEVRFHQGRYVHDFIYSVCHQALISAHEPELAIDDSTGEIFPASRGPLTRDIAVNPDTSFVTPLRTETRSNTDLSVTQSLTPSRIQASSAQAEQNTTRQYSPAASHPYTANVNEQASKAYSDLMTPLVDTEQVPETNAVSHDEISVNSSLENSLVSDEETKILHWLEPHYLVFQQQQELRLLSVKKIDLLIKLQTVKQRWHEKLICQPLLLPIKITVSEKIAYFVEINEIQFQHIGMEIRQLNKTTLQVRQFPALLRNRDIASSFDRLIKQLQVDEHSEVHSEIEWQMALAGLMVNEELSQEQALQVWRNAKSQFNCQFEQQLRLNSVVIDLTSFISLLE